jgi:endoglucanase
MRRPTLTAMRTILLAGLLAGPAAAQQTGIGPGIARCVNLGNALDAPSEGAWGPALTEADLDWVAQAGFDTVRLPVRFSAHWYGRIEPHVLARVDEVLGWALDRGLNVILDVHHFEEMMRYPAGQEPVLAAIWAELTRHYADAPEGLVFELLNEPNGMLTTAMMIRLNARLVDLIREGQPDRWIVLGGGQWNSLDEMMVLPPAGHREILSFHYYAPFEFTHQLATWVDPVMPAATWGTADDRDAMQSAIARAATAPGPVLLGEFGVYGEAALDQRLDWTGSLRRAAEQKGMAWCVWAYDAGFPVQDRATGDWLPGMRAALME